MVSLVSDSVHETVVPSSSPQAIAHGEPSPTMPSIAIRCRILARKAESEQEYAKHNEQQTTPLAAMIAQATSLMIGLMALPSFVGAQVPATQMDHLAGCLIILP